MDARPCVRELCTICGKTPGRHCSSTDKWIKEEAYFERKDAVIDAERLEAFRTPGPSWTTITQTGWDQWGRRTYREPRDLG